MMTHDARNPIYTVAALLHGSSGTGGNLPSIILTTFKLSVTIEIGIVRYVVSCRPNNNLLKLLM